VSVHRLSITGAHFANDSAYDAMRGLNHAGLEVAPVISKLFPRARFLAFMEDGHPADIPEIAQGVELYQGHRSGGRSSVPLVRWSADVTGIKALRELLGEPTTRTVAGFAVLRPDTNAAELWEQVYPLVSLGTLDSPPAHYQPAAIAPILEECSALILIHHDKQGPALGIYSSQALDVSAKLGGLAAAQSAMLVPFAIPPMLARWDRALWELRQSWDEDALGAFPVPSASDPSAWDPRRRDRRRRRKKPPATPEVADTPQLDDDLLIATPPEQALDDARPNVVAPVEE